MILSAQPIRKRCTCETPMIAPFHERTLHAETGMTNRKKRHFSHPDTLHRKKAILGVAVSQKMIAAAQASYDGSAEYGLGDGDMKKAIEAALKVAAEESK